MSTWDKLTQNFPKELYHFKPFYLYKESDDSHYLYVEYPLKTGKNINIVLNVKMQDYFCGFYDYDGRYSARQTDLTLSYIKRYYDLISYRYVDSYRKGWD